MRRFAAGWYPDEREPGSERYWDGEAWTEQTRESQLENRIAEMVRKGYRVESQTETQAVMVKGHRPNNTFHLIASIVTVGLWAIFVWLPVLIFSGEKRKVVT